MGASDFLNEDLAVRCADLAGEILKTYQHLPWAMKNEAVSRLKRQIFQLDEEVKKAQASESVATTQRHLQEAVSLIHECVPLLDLCLRKVLVSQELHTRWIKRLGEIEVKLSEWLRGISGR